MTNTINEISMDSFEAFKTYYEHIKENAFQKNLKSYKKSEYITRKLKKFASDNFDEEDYIGRGTYKVVYKFDDDTVLKIARPRDFKDMLKVYNSEYRSLVPDIIDGGHYWVRSQKVTAEGVETFKEVFKSEIKAMRELYNEENAHSGLLDLFQSIIISSGGVSLPKKSIERLAIILKDNPDIASEGVRRTMEEAKEKGFSEEVIVEEIYIHHGRTMARKFYDNKSGFTRDMLRMSYDLLLSIGDVHYDNVGYTEYGRRVIIDI